MKAFSLSPGGLLLPYHLGAIGALTEHGLLQPSIDVVGGSSAGAIATMAYGAGLKPTDILEATINVSDQCCQLGRARGNLLPLLEQEMEQRVGEEEFLFLQEERSIGIAYTEIFPRRVNHLQQEFKSREDLFRAVSWSCMFPFFATNYPCKLDTSSDGILPRLMVDGFFSVPRERFGCPEFTGIDRHIGISVFPKNLIGMTAFDDEDCISPSTEDFSIEELFLLATEASSRPKLTNLFETGWKDGEDFCSKEARRDRVTGAA
jgi:hypothetical protein